MVALIVPMVAYLSLLLVLSISVILLNGLFMISLVKTKSLHTPSNAVLGCLCCSDLLIGVASFLAWAIDIASIVRNQLISYDIFVVIFQALMVFTGFSSLFIILATCDRYAAICHPYKYRQYATSKLYAIISICTCLVYALAISLSYVMDEFYQTYSRHVILAIVFLATSAVLIYCNWKILRVIRRHRRQIASVERHFERQNSGFQCDTNRYYIVLLLLILFGFCKIPRIIFFFNINRTMNLLSFITLIITDFMLQLNSLLNPLVYCFRIRLFRNAMKELICCK